MTRFPMTRMLGVAVLLTCCGLPGAGAAAGEAASAASEAAPTRATATLLVRGDRLFLPVRLNGVETRNALLDSGAELSLVDAGFARHAGLAMAGTETARGTGGEEEVSFAHGVTIEAAGIVLEDRTVAVLDLGPIAARVVGWPLSLVVGRELFDAARLFIDIETATLAAVPRDGEPAGQRLAMQTHKGLQTIPVTVEGGQPVQADFDLGNGNEVLIGAAYAERAGLLAPGRITGQKSGGGIGGEVVRDLVVLKALEVAGVTFNDVPAAIDRTDTAADVNIGVRILRNFRITADFAENAVWLEPR